MKEERSGEEENEKVGARAHVNARERMCLHVCMNKIGGEHDSKRVELRIDRVAQGWSSRQLAGLSSIPTRVVLRE